MKKIIKVIAIVLGILIISIMSVFFKSVVKSVVKSEYKSRNASMVADSLVSSINKSSIVTNTNSTAIIKRAYKEGVCVVVIECELPSYNSTFDKKIVQCMKEAAVDNLKKNYGTRSLFKDPGIAMKYIYLNKADTLCCIYISESDFEDR